VLPESGGDQVEYRILGPLEVFHAGAVVHVGGPRHRRLLAALLMEVGEVVSAARLISALWGEDPPASAPAMLHVRVAELRAVMRAAGMSGTECIVTQHPGYRLEVGADALDSRRFERLAAAGRQALAIGDHAGAAVKLAEALALWRGPPLAEVADEPFARGEVARLEALRLQTVEDRLEADLALGRHGDVITELEALVAGHPLRERFWAQLMLARYRGGRQGDALQAYQAVRALLVEQLGVEPGPELRRLHTAILTQDRGLELPSSVPAEPPSNLPGHIASFVGREWDMAEIRELSRRDRLITLVGAGGSASLSPSP
jgi:DNA-binding SARP family transcriptional activator